MRQDLMQSQRVVQANAEGLFGEELKDKLMDKTIRIGSMECWFAMMGETIPKETNYVALDNDKKDEWGIPQIKIAVDYDDNDEKMIKDFFEQYDGDVYKGRFHRYKNNR